MAPSLKTIDAAETARLRDAGALIVDVREAHEYAGMHIPGSENVALSGWDGAELSIDDGQAVVFLCASGARTATHAARLAAGTGTAEAHVLQGGIAAWKRAGLPISAPTGGDRAGGLLSRMLGR